MVYYNPLHPHCGPFNSVARLRPKNAVDAACWSHDKSYGRLGKRAYFNWNSADEKMLKILERQGRRRQSLRDRVGGRVYGSYLRVKRKLAPRMKEFKRQKIISQKSVQKSMPMFRRRFNRPWARRSKRRVFVSRRRKFAGRKRRRVYRGKRRRGSGVRAALSAMCPSSVKRIYSRVAQSLTPGKWGIVYGGASFDWNMYIYDYTSGTAATGQSGNPIINNKENAQKQYSVGRYLKSMVTNVSNRPIYVTPIFCTITKDMVNKNIPYDGAWHLNRLPETVMQALYYGCLDYVDAADDTQYTYVGAVGSTMPTQRIDPTVQGSTGYPHATKRLTQNMKMKHGKRRVMAPGMSMTFGISSKKMKLLPQVQTNTDMYPAAYAKGLTKFILYKVEGDICGTNEAAGSSYDNLKISRASWQISLNITSTQVYKRLENNFADKAVISYLPTIAGANERVVADTSVDPNQVPEEMEV